MVDSNQRFATMWRVPADVLDSRQDDRLLAFVLDQLRAPEVFLAKVRDLYGQSEATSLDTLEFKDGRVFERFSMPQKLDGRSIGRVWSFRDVTEVRRQAQALRDSERRLMQAQKLEAIGRLAGGVAHDFNNMLTAILGETQLLLMRLPEESGLRESLDNIRGAAERASRLTRHLLAFGQRQHAEPRVIALRDVVTSIEPLVRRLAGPRVTLDIRLGSSSPHVFADPALLEQVIVNLVLNARDAMPEGGKLSLHISSTHETPSGNRARSEGWALLVVTDSGAGIEPDVLPHLFEPFFTTKQTGRGTGLGLASVYGVVQQSGGSIDVDSKPGLGAKFTVWLPQSVAPVVPAPAAPPREAGPSRGSETILLVEDESVVRGLVTALLREGGYRVIEATSGEQALRIARAEPGEIALLLSDVVMPGMAGPALAATLIRDRPALRVLFMSGYPGVPDVSGRSLPLLGKPFTSEQLRAQVRLAIDAAP